jgi:2-alkyl-3-oxoalkanoate reductase
VLRYGFFYGPGTGYAPGQPYAEAVRAGKMPIVGEGNGRYPFIHVDDAAAATVRAIELGAAGIYNIVDDEPAPTREWLPELAKALGAKPPRRVPAWFARLVAGPVAVIMGTDGRGASNAKAKRQLGWTLRYPSWRQGFVQAYSGLGEVSETPHNERIRASVGG